MEPTEMITSAPNDTIAAISTPAGVGGIAVCRVSGPQAFDIVGLIWRGKPFDDMKSHTVHLGEIVDSRGEPLDQAVATIFRAPASFTGDNVVELSVHGSRYIQRELLASLIAAGARLALPGEFTRRAFAAGKIDLAQAEAVADVIASDSRAAHRLAFSQMKGRFSSRIAQLRTQLVDLTALLELELDFSEEDVEFASRAKLLDLANSISIELRRLHNSFNDGSAIKSGIPVAIIGDTNAGKSSLLNILTGDDRAIVSDIHGTTRDTIEELIPIGDYTFRFIDTAGLRDTADAIERIGITRSLQAMERARIILLVADITRPINLDLLHRAQAITSATTILLLNKTDLAPNPDNHPYAQSDLSDHTDLSSLSASTSLSDLSDQSDQSASSDLSDQSDLSDLSDQSASSDLSDQSDQSASSDLSDQSDLFDLSTLSSLPLQVIPISAATGQGIDRLRRTLTDVISSEDTPDVIVTNLRHAESLKAAADAVDRVIDGLRSGLPGDLISQDLRLTIHHLADITGDIPSTEILTTIFSRFCIGK